MRDVYDVILHNEGEGEPILYDVTATSPQEAVAEAWRQYRDLPYVDDEQPPKWAKPIVQAAVHRPNGETPVFERGGRDWYHPEKTKILNLSNKAVRL